MEGTKTINEVKTPVESIYKQELADVLKSRLPEDVQSNLQTAIIELRSKLIACEIIEFDEKENEVVVGKEKTDLVTHLVRKINENVLRAFQVEILSGQIEDAAEELTRERSKVTDLRDRLDVAMHDDLTGLERREYSKSRFKQIAKALKREAYKEPQKLSLIIIDLDHFKNVNDAYGHPAGDEVLRVAALRTKQMVRETDIVTRWGGEEFVVILPTCDFNSANSVAEKIRSAITAKPIEFLSNDAVQNLKVTASLGVTTRTITKDFKENHEELLGEIVNCADDMLYSAKDSGRDQVKSTLFSDWATQKER